MSELFLVRHAQACFGTAEYDRLSDLGHKQARWLGEYFRGRGLSFDKVLCGNMARHHETAQAILAGMQLPPQQPDTDPGWNEFDFQAIVAAYLEQFPGDKPSPDASYRDFSRILRSALLAWSEDRLESPLPEQWRQFEERVARALATLARDGSDHARVLLVSSGGPISMALRQVLEAPAGAMVHMNLQLRNSSFSHLFFNAHSVHFSGFNHVPHLDRPDRSAAVTYY